MTVAVKIKSQWLDLDRDHSLGLNDFSVKQSILTIGLTQGMNPSVLRD